VHPELGVVVEEKTEPDRGVGGDGAAPVDEFVDPSARDAERLGEVGLRNPQRLQITRFEELPGWRARREEARRGSGRTRFRAAVARRLTLRT